jgi:hypothetical protein
MRPFVLVCAGWLLISLGGCAFKRSDFVCGADGKPEGELSPSAKTAAALMGGPKVRINY